MRKFLTPFLHAGPAAFLAVFLALSVAHAADQPQGAAPNRGGGNRPAGAERGRGGFPLDDQQRQLLREAMQKDRDTLAQLGDKLRIAQKELMAAVLAEKYDEKVVRQKAEVVAKIQVELTVVRAKAVSDVAPTLKAEQREQLEDSPLGAALLTSGWMDFGGRRDRGGAPNRQQ